MNAKSMSHSKHKQELKYVELGAYIVLASALIGHVLFVDGQVSAGNIVLIAMGIVFGIMASMTWTPFSTRLDKPVALDLAEVFSFRKHSNTNKADDRNDRRAA